MYSSNIPGALTQQMLELNLSLISLGSLGTMKTSVVLLLGLALLK